MHNHLLTGGTLLDERYRIDKVLGEGGFGITYSAQNVRIGLNVAIKELFWRGHSMRDAQQGPEVSLMNDADAPVFAEQKQRFLREARIIRDFSDLPGAARILDYFEANGTAYIVMEYVQGETLSAWLRSHGRMAAEDAFIRFLPLIDSLAHIHAGGVIHRDISPDNIIIQPDGSLRLIDFGAARMLREGEGGYTAIVKDSYAPGEQYDKNGRQGPWTDVYALCATMYACITGAAPVSAVQRMFLDELKKPSELGAEILPAYEAILMRGLEMNTARRFAGMDELAQAMRAALPAPKEKSGRRKSILLGAAAGLICIAAALGIFLYHQYDQAHKFRGIETETFYLNAPNDMTAAEFAQAQEAVEEKLRAFAGEDNYILEVQGAQLRAELPLEVFGGEEIAGQLDEHFYAPVEGKPFAIDMQIQAIWEDPALSPIAGENQVKTDALTGKTAVYVYSWTENLTKGQRANLLMDFKVRLDALGAPYAFGTLYGNDDALVFRIAPQSINNFVLSSIGGYGLTIAASYSNLANINLSHNIYRQEITIAECDGGKFALQYAYDPEDYEIQQLEEVLQALGEDTVYLECSRGPVVSAIVQASMAEARETGIIEFRDFRFDALSEAGGENRWIADYVHALLNETDLPAICTLKMSDLLDEEGNTLFGQLDSSLYGLHTLLKPCDVELRRLIQKISDEQGYACSESTTNSILWLELGLEVNSDLAENIAEAITALLEEYDFSKMVINPSVIICCIDEQGSERCRICLNGSWDYDTAQYFNEISCLYTTEGRLESQAEAFIQWWEAADFSGYGLIKQ